MNKKHFYLFGVVFIVAVVFQFAIEYYFGMPAFINETLESKKSDKVLMKEIGGYSGYELFYKPDEMEYKDTVDYKVTIKGRYKRVEFYGKASKNSDNIWETISVERVSE